MDYRATARARVIGRGAMPGHLSGDAASAAPHLDCSQEFSRTTTSTSATAARRTPGYRQNARPGAAGSELGHGFFSERRPRRTRTGRRSSVPAAMSMVSFFRAIFRLQPRWRRERRRAAAQPFSHARKNGEDTSENWPRGLRQLRFGSHGFAGCRGMD